MEEPSADIDRVNFFRAVRKHQIREAAGGRPDVRRCFSCKIGREFFKRILELAGAAADEFIAAVDGQDGVRGELLRGFRDKRIFAAPDLACHDQQRGVLTAFAVTVFV